MAGANERLEESVGRAAENLDLEVPAAGGATYMICRATRRGSTGIVPGYDWKEPVRECHRPRNDFLSLHNSKRVSTQAPRLLTIVGLAGRRAGEAMCATIRLGAMLPEVPAADVEDTIDEQITALSPQRSERNILDVPQQPGGLVIQ